MLVSAWPETPHVQTSDKTLRLVNTMWHALVKELGNEEVLQEVIAWLDARVGAVPRSS